MSFLYTDEQLQIRDGAFRALTDSYAPDRLRALLETSGRHDEEFWQMCRDMGWTALAIPQEYDGLGLGLIELTLIAEAAGRVVSGAPFLLSSFAAAQAILLSDAVALKAEILPALASGEKIGTIAFGLGANPVAPEPCASWHAGVLTGTYEAVLAGVQADFAVVLASNGTRPVLVLAELAEPSVARTVIDGYDNSRGIATLAFAGTPARLVLEEDAVSAAWSVLDRAAVVLAAEQIGGADMCLELARDYANTRQAFGQPIGKFQAIKHKLAEIYVANQIARANCLEAAFRHDSGIDGFTALASAARVSATEAYDLACREGTQIFGGIGATWESDMHLHMRRARGTAGILGERSIWEDRIVANLEASA